MSAALKPAALVQLYRHNVAIVEAVNARVSLTVMSASECEDDAPYKPAESVSVYMDLPRARELMNALAGAIGTLEARAAAEASGTVKRAWVSP